MQTLLVWLLATLLAIALMGDRPHLGLTMALLGGMALGLSAFLNYPAGPEETPQSRPEPRPEQ